MRIRTNSLLVQNAFHEYITSKGFDLERDLPIEETGAKHQKIEELKKIILYTKL